MSSDSHSRKRTVGSGSGWIPSNYTLIVISVGVFATALGAVSFTRGSQQIATIWVANAILSVTLLRSSPRSWPVIMVTGYATDVAANLVAGRALAVAFGLPACNLIEVFLIASALRRPGGQKLDLSRLSHFGLFVLIGGVAAPALTGILAAALLTVQTGASFSGVWLVWFPADALGILVFTPLLLLLRTKSALKLLAPRQRLETVAWFCTIIAVTAFTFNQNAYPLLFLPMALLGVLAVRLGTSGMSLSIVIVAVIAMVATIRGHGPLMLIPGDIATRILVLQIFIVVTVLSKLPLTALLAERTRLEARAGETNQQLLLAEKIAQVGHWRLDVKNNALTWSDEVYRMHGVDPRCYEPTVEKAIAAYHPDDRDLVQQWVANATETAGEYEFNARLVRMDGAVRDVVSRGLCEIGTGGEVTAVFGTIMDVTALRQAERAVADSEARYRLLADNTTDMITQMDLNGRRLSVSPGSRALLGYEPSELIGTDVPNMIHTDDVAVFRGVLSSLVAGQDHAITVNRLRHKAGDWIWVEASLKVLRGPQGEAVGFVASVRNIVDRRNASEALQESEARYRLLADHSSDLIALKSTFAGPRTYVSPSSLRLFGYSPDEFAALPAADLVHPDDQEIAARDYASLSAENPHVTSVHRVRHKAGHWLWADTAFTLANAGERDQCVIVRARDVTARQEAEQARVASEARYRLLAETTSDVITRLDLDFNRTYVSPSCRRLLGFEPEEMLGKRPSAAIHPDDAPAVRELARALIDGESADERITTTYRTRHKDGRWVSVEANMAISRDEGGAIDSLVCSLRDVTERHAAEAATTASEARFRLLAENTNELIILGHDDGRRSYISAASQRLLGFLPEELAAMPLRDYVHPDDLADLYRTTGRLRQESAVAMVYRAKRKHGDWIWVEGQFRRIPEARDGDPTIIGTFRDITERQVQADALRIARDAAETAAALADQASQAKTDFLAAMSHEIRTPLNGVLGYTDILLEDPQIEGDRRKHLERIRNAGGALRTIVDDILDFSKIEAGRIDLVPIPFSPSALIDGAVSIVKGGLGGKPLAIRTDLDPDLPETLVGDHDRLRQILLNLLNNAVKFTPSGTVALSIRRLAYDDQEAKLRFAVSDTGIGIPEDRRSLLFQRFSQVDSSIRRIYGGTGLGLAICRSLVEAMGGTIGVDTVHPHGSCFWFDVTLPVSEGRLVIDEREPNPASNRLVASILLAEDNEINQDLARAVIEAAGHKLDIVENGAEAIHAVLSKRYDLVLMDVQMPVMDGISATRHIRGIDHPNKDVTIVGMSAYVLPAQTAEFRRAGMNDHIGKPFKQQELRAMIARWASVAAEKDCTSPVVLIDREIHLDLIDAVGYEAVLVFSNRAMAEVQALVAAAVDSPERASLARQAHGLIAAVGTLGFSELADLLRRLEDACGQNGEIRPLLETIDAARVRAEAEKRILAA